MDFLISKKTAHEMDVIINDCTSCKWSPLETNVACSVSYSPFVRDIRCRMRFLGALYFYLFTVRSVSHSPCVCNSFTVGSVSPAHCLFNIRYTKRESLDFCV